MSDHDSSADRSSLVSQSKSTQDKEEESSVSSEEETTPEESSDVVEKAGSPDEPSSTTQENDADTVLSFKGDDFVQIAWKDLKYQVKKKSEIKCSPSGGCTGFDGEQRMNTILDDVSGFVNPGSMLAILGPSGAGKTSLLNLLSMRIKNGDSGKVEGSITINGQTPTRSKFRKISSFVAQDDILMGSQTPWEALRMTARLTLGGELSDQEIDKRITSLLKEMGLWHVKDNFIGYMGDGAVNSGIKRGLSGGERKRVSVCVELIHDPKLLFLDEPTSGLDSFAARAVVDCLRSQANQGRTIICTIHQPSAEIYRMFDQVMVLAAGRTVYLGPTKEANGYFKSIGYPCPPFTNPADHIIKIVQVPKDEGEDKDGSEPDGNDPENPKESNNKVGLRHVTKEQVQSLVACFSKSELGSRSRSPPPPPTDGLDNLTKTHKKAGAFKAFSLLVERSMNNVWREPMLFKTRIFQTIFMGVLAGLIFLRLKMDLTGAGDRISGGFFIVMNQMFGSINGPTLLFPYERAVFFREKGAGLYSTAPYFIAKLVSETPINVLTPILSGVIAWWMIGFNDDPVNFFGFLVIIVVLSNLGFSLGILLNVIFLDPGVVNRVQPLILLPFMLFAGFFINLASIPVWVSWLEHISFVKYSFRSTMNFIMAGLTFTCADKDLRWITIPINTTNTTNTTFNSFDPLAPSPQDPFAPAFPANETRVLACLAPTGEDYLKSLGALGYNPWVDILINVGFMVLFLILGFIILHFRKPKI